MSFRLKTILGIGLIEIVLLSVLVFSGLRYLQTSNESQLIERAKTTAQLFATMTTDAVVSMDLATLEEMVKKTISNPSITFLRVRHTSGAVLSEHGNESLLQRPFEAETTINDMDEDHSFDVSADILVGQEKVGRVELGVDTGTLEGMLKDAENKMFGVAVLEILLVAIFGFLLGGMLTRQLKSLQKGAEQVSRGELGHEIEVKGRDELAETAICFNKMTRALAGYARDLEAARALADEKRIQAETVLAHAINSLTQGVLILDGDNRIVHVNKAYSDIYELDQARVDSLKTGEELCLYFGECQSDVTMCKTGTSEGDLPVTQLANGRHIMHSYRPMATGGGIWVDTDITQILEVEQKNRQLERELIQSQKMESIGTLAGGIAHEINTPIQYIGDNIRFLGEALEDMNLALDAYRTLAETVRADQSDHTDLLKCDKAYKEADIDYLREELPLAVDQSLDGVKQVSNIVLAMKEFAHPTSKDKAEVDINRVIERAAAVCKNEWKALARLDLDLEESLPVIHALEGELNQVMLNMIVNAAHAIEAAGQSDGKIRISTRSDPNGVCLTIEDNGTGIPDNIRDKIFNPFFTTKEVGKGSGQGLAITRDIIVKKHDGKIIVSNREGGGACFALHLPYNSFSTAA